MDYTHYTFSNEVKSELLEFYKIARSKRQENPKSHIWEIILPKNKLLINELSQLQITNVIDLTDVIEANPVSKDLTNNIIIDEINAEIKTSVMDDVIESLKENLEIESGLSERFIKKLETLNDEQLTGAFCILSEHLDTESICKFGNGILDNDSLQCSRIIEYFNRHILIPKLFIEHNSQIYGLLLKFLNSFFNITCRELVSKFQEVAESTKCIQENLMSLKNTIKQKLLKEFILSTRKLDKHQFPIIDCLLSDEIDIESIQKLIELLIAISSLFSNDKIFGRLILSLMSNAKTKIPHFEQQLTHIISLHRSVWKNKLSKTLAECMENNHSLSQSLRY